MAEYFWFDFVDGVYRNVEKGNEFYTFDQIVGMYGVENVGSDWARSNNGEPTR